MLRVMDDTTEGARLLTPFFFLFSLIGGMY